MTKLHEFAQRLPEKSVLSQEETTSIKGGKRYLTTSYSRLRSMRDSVRAQGHTTRTSKHGNEYCLEW